MNQQEKYDTLVEILTSLPGSYIGEHHNHKITPERASEVASLIHLHGWSMKGVQRTLRTIEDLCDRLQQDREKWQHGRIMSDDGSSCRHYWVFRPHEAPTDDDALRLAGYPEEYYSGPGRSFGGVPHVQRKGSRVLVTWFTGLDI